MYRHKNFEIRGKLADLNSFINKLRQDNNPMWPRDHDFESRLKETYSDNQSFLVYNPGEHEDFPRAGLILVLDEAKSRIHVPNIVPDPEIITSIDARLYNRIVNRFNDDVVSPLANELKLEIIEGVEEETPESICSPEVMKKLKYFASAANKSTGASHPLDQQRWHSFIIAAFEEDSKLPIDVLEEWLKTEGGFPEDVIAELTIEYGNALDILKQYVKTAR